jgi:hypothetical protein
MWLNINVKINGFSHAGKLLSNFFLRGPHNRYDKHASEVFSGEAKLGYIPCRADKTIARLMDKGIIVQAEIKELFPDGDAVQAG